METAPHEETAPARPGTVVLDRYALLEEIGSGGFGAVWLARDERLERPVAIKRIPVRGNGATAERAEREALVAARLSHPAVVSLYESGRDGEAVYLVSELVRGHTLGDLLAEGALSDRDVLLIGMAMCDALAHAHSRGVIHRDVKPGNVLVPETPDDGVVAKLTDFGIARMAGDEALTATGDVVGTLAYMAPEQAEGRGATAASDLYSLALVLFEALTGVNPVRGSNAAATARQVGMRLPPLRRLRRDLPRGLGAAIDACVLADPAMRGSIDSLRLALAEALHDVGDEPGTVEAPGWAMKPTYSAGLTAQRWRERTARMPKPAPGKEAALRGEAASGEEDPHARPWRPHIGIPARLAAAAMTAGLVLAALSLTETRPPLDPAALAALGAAAVALLPRIGWILTAGALVAFLGNEGNDAWWAIGVAALPLPLLLPLRPAWWSAPGIAVGLGYLGVACAWPALAGQAKGLWTRAILGAAGFWWLSVVALLLNKRLIVDPAQDLKDLVQQPSLALAGVWAAAAAVLPIFTRGRNVGLDLLGACVWATALALGTQTVAEATNAGDPRGVVGAAALAALLALLAGALRRT